MDFVALYGWTACYCIIYLLMAFFLIIIIIIIVFEGAFLGTQGHRTEVQKSFEGKTIKKERKKF